MADALSPGGRSLGTLQGLCLGERGLFLQVKHGVPVASPEVTPGLLGARGWAQRTGEQTGRGRCGVTLAGRPGTCDVTSVWLLSSSVTLGIEARLTGDLGAGGDLRTGGPALGLCRQPGPDTAAVILPSGHCLGSAAPHPRLGSPLLAFPALEAAGEARARATRQVLGRSRDPDPVPPSLLQAAMGTDGRAWVAGCCGLVRGPVSLPLHPSLSPFLCRMVEYSLDLQNINLSAIRTVRVLRPLKAINRVPSELAPPVPPPRRWQPFLN